MTSPRRRQIYKPLRIGDDVANQLDGHLSYGASSFSSLGSSNMASDMISYLSLFRLWFACVTESLNKGFATGFDYLRAFEAKALQDAVDVASGKTRAPALIPETARAPEAPKIMLSRSTKRMLARGLPACRRYDWFRYASSRTLNGNQFFELLGRLSVHGRAGIYRLEYKARLCVRRPQNRVLCGGESLVGSGGLSFGICAAHLWPN